ncbi:MAG: hypothetical protein LH467_16425 [Gemmatimonadaceae bacterium]|nr:hypothetical protein [Gemmatimonadaceae bacterium]
MLPLFALLACGGDGSTSPGASIAGAYSLTTVNGAPLPFVAQQAGTYKYEITADTYTLADGATWTEVRADRTTSNGAITTSTKSDAGTWSRNGTSITLTSPANGAVSGTVSGNTLTLSSAGNTMVFTK